MTRWIHTSAALLCAAAWVGPASALTFNRPDCDVTVQELGEAKVNHYNALDGGEYLEPIRLRLRNQADDACVGKLRIINILGGSQLVGIRGRLNYQIVDQNNSSSIVFDPVTNQSIDIPVIVPANGTIEIRPQLRVPGSQPGRAGRYAALLTAVFVSPAGRDIGTEIFSVAAQVEPSAQANFVGFASGGTANLDLGELSPGLSRSIGLQIRASSDVEVAVNSENDGFLEHNGSSARIPYTMTVNGALVDLSRRDRMDIDLADPVLGQTNPISVTVGNFANAPVGSYGDVVTFRISAR